MPYQYGKPPSRRAPTRDTLADPTLVPGRKGVRTLVALGQVPLPGVGLRPMVTLLRHPETHVFFIRDTAGRVAACAQLWAARQARALGRASWRVTHHDHAHRATAEPFHFTAYRAAEPTIEHPDAWADGFADNH